jgi:hydroxypyruvate isomerase
MEVREHKVSRRQTLAAGVAGALATVVPAVSNANSAASVRLKQSVCRWCYGSMSLEDLAAQAKRIGLLSVELLSEGEWPVVQKLGLTCAVANGPGGITDGWNEEKNHAGLIAGSERILPLVAKAGIPNMIVFSGNRRNLTDEQGIQNCAKGLRQITPLAEKLGVTVIMELLNSRVDHGDYQCDRTEWGVKLVQAVGSPRFKLLYDIYHMQIMEGDVIRTIQRHHEAIAHYHTGGNPGRNEIDETQELNYRRICEAVVETGFTGYLAQEFIPRRDPMTSLEQAFRICNV